MNTRGTLSITVRLRRLSPRVTHSWAATCHPGQPGSWSYGDTGWDAICKTIEREKFRKRSGG